MIHVSKIVLDRAEGPTQECGEKTARSWAEANTILMVWSKTAPPQGKGYNKVDFVIHWEDGEKYEGRYDLNQEGEDGVKGHSLAGHILDFLGFEAHKAVCAGYFKANPILEVEEERASALAFAEKYIPGTLPVDEWWCCGGDKDA